MPDLVFDIVSWFVGGLFLLGGALAGADFCAGRRKARIVWPWLLIFSGPFLAVRLFFWAGGPVSLSYSPPQQTQTAVSEKNTGRQIPSKPAVPALTPPKARIPVSSSAVLLDVPFTPQAPFGNWADLRQEDGCEEASALMAVRWARWELLTPEEAEREIIKISDYELATYGNFKETSIRDTAERILRGYFQYENFEVRHNIGTEDIKAEINRGNAVIIAVDGQKLANPFYTPPGPRDHMVVVRGYDPATKEFIVNDPGTKRGEKFRYSESVLQNALQDYPTGEHEPITQKVGAMIIVRRAF